MNKRPIRVLSTLSLASISLAASARPTTRLQAPALRENQQASVFRDGLRAEAVAVPAVPGPAAAMAFGLMALRRRKRSA